MTGLVLVAFYKLKTGQAIWIRGGQLRPLKKEVVGLGIFIAVFLASGLIINVIQAGEGVVVINGSNLVIAGVVTWIWAKQFMLAESG